jgi:hypothetical protein
MSPLFKTTILLCATIVVAASFGIAQQNASSPGGSLEELLDKREKKLTTIVNSFRVGHESGHVSFESLVRAELDLISARLETAETKHDRIDLLEARVRHLEDLERQMQTAVAAGKATSVELWRVEVEHLNAKIALHREHEAG